MMSPRRLNILQQSVRAYAGFFMFCYIVTLVRKQSCIVPDAPLDRTVTEDGFLADINVQLPEADGRDASRKGLDIIEFFGNPFNAINGNGKRIRVMGDFDGMVPHVLTEVATNFIPQDHLL